SRRIDLYRNRRGRKTSTRKRAARGLWIAHEMADVIEKNLLAPGELTADLRTCGGSHENSKTRVASFGSRRPPPAPPHSGAAPRGRPCWSRRAAIRRRTRRSADAHRRAHWQARSA